MDPGIDFHLNIKGRRTLGRVDKTHLGYICLPFFTVCITLNKTEGKHGW